MCLILFAYETHPRYRLVFAANRDEFYSRPTAPAAFWENAPDVLGGRDLKLGGTWLGITRSGRLAAVTNYRDPKTFHPTAKSRGMLVSNFLKQSTAAPSYLRRVAGDKDTYNPFNLVLGDEAGFFWFSNRVNGICRISPGIHGLSNRLLDTPWPKVRRGVRLLTETMACDGTQMEKRLFSMLTDRFQPPDAELPDTGVALEWERVLSPIFIQSPTYGTRSSTVVLIGRDNRIVFSEQTFYPSASGVREGPFRRFVFEVEAPK